MGVRVGGEGGSRAATLALRTASANLCADARLLMPPLYRLCAASPAGVPSVVSRSAEFS